MPAPDTSGIWGLSIAEELLLFSRQPFGAPTSKHWDDNAGARHLVATGAFAQLAIEGRLVLVQPGVVRLAEPTTGDRFTDAVLTAVTGTLSLKELFGARDAVHDAVIGSLAPYGIVTKLEPTGLQRLSGANRFEVRPPIQMEDAWAVYRDILTGQRAASARAALLLHVVLQVVGAEWLFLRDPLTLDSPGWFKGTWPMQPPTWWDTWPTDALPAVFEAAARDRKKWQ